LSVVTIDGDHFSARYYQLETIRRATRRALEYRRANLNIAVM